MKLDSPTYIYKITEKISQKSYIGKTKNAPFFRWWDHLKHSNSPFGRYLSQTQLDEWTFEVVKIIDSSISATEVFEIETAFILKFNSIADGFNQIISKCTDVSNPILNKDLV